MLLLLDCCQAARAVTKSAIPGTKEVLASCARESFASGPGGSYVPGSAFTYCLTRTLKLNATLHRGFVITQLQTWLSFDEVLKDQSPVHVVLAGHDKPIILRPLISEPESNAHKLNRNSLDQYKSTRVLLSIALREGTELRVGECVRWLTNLCPQNVTGVEVEDVVKVTVEAAFLSHSTILIVSLPMSVWARLPSNAGVSFVGFATSRNLIHSQDNKVQRHFFQSLKDRNFQAMKMLFDLGADINEMNRSGWTPLCCAIKEDDELGVEQLLKLGANVEIRCYLGITAFQLAVTRDSTTIVKLLLKKGAKTPSRDLLISALASRNFKREMLLELLPRVEEKKVASDLTLLQKHPEEARESIERELTLRERETIRYLQTEISQSWQKKSYQSVQGSSWVRRFLG